MKSWRFALLVILSLCASAGQLAALSGELQDEDATVAPVDLFAPRVSGTPAGQGARVGWTLVQQQGKVSLVSARSDGRRFDLGVDVLGDVDDEWRLRLRFHVRRGKPLVGWLLQW